MSPIRARRAPGRSVCECHGRGSRTPVRDLTARGLLGHGGRGPADDHDVLGRRVSRDGRAGDRSELQHGRAPLTMARTAGRVFLASLRPDDRAMLIGIGGEVECSRRPPPAWSHPARGRARPARRVGHDVAARCHHHVARSARARAGPPRDRAALRRRRPLQPRERGGVLERVKRSNVLIYPIAIGLRAVPLFAELAMFSGGRAMDLPNPEIARAGAEVGGRGSAVAISAGIFAGEALGRGTRMATDCRSTWRGTRTCACRRGEGTSRK